MGQVEGQKIEFQKHIGFTNSVCGGLAGKSILPLSWINDVQGNLLRELNWYSLAMQHGLVGVIAKASLCE
jgi:hypothetical protein